MVEAAADQSVIRTADGVPLKVKLRRVTRIERLKTFLLAVPLLAVVTVSFIVPIGDMLLRSVHTPQINELLSGTMSALDDWDGEAVPDEHTFSVLGRELLARAEDRKLGIVALRMNYAISGMRSLLYNTVTRLQETDSQSYRSVMLDLDERWGQIETWRTLRRVGQPFTARFYLESLDMRFASDGAVAMQPEYLQIYQTLFIRTLWVSLLITALCLVLGYPIAYLMANLPQRTANLLIILVLLPFWTSLLVRTTAWIVLLQSEGVLNDILVWSGLIGADDRLQMIYNMTGTIVAMTHILLPFMVLPLYSVMRTIPASYSRAAQSLGATPLRAFWDVYAPNTLPGIGAGSLLVFILAVGYYITPALVGGRTGQLIGNMIAYHVQQSLNWGLAAALGAILLAGVLILYWLYNRLVGIDNMRLN